MRFLALALALGLSVPAVAQAQSDDRPDWAIVIHGGAGVIERESMTPETEAAYRAAMDAAVTRGRDVLEAGGSSLDAVEAVIQGLEDDAMFNSGRGAVFTAEGRNELDASIMDGETMNAGAVAGVTNVRHPISLARAVMENSRHVMLQGAGAETFAEEQGLELVEPVYFFTERRWQALERALEGLGLPIPDRPEGAQEPEEVDHTLLERDALEHRFGTVGVVAMDMNGHIAAGTSTGGTTAKRWGRVGDSPVIGAGTYADARCGVSATGTGEYFIRLSVAARICMEVEMGDRGAEEIENAGQTAADLVIHGALTDMGGDGGVIVLTSDGRPGWSFNTPGMYRASQVAGEDPVIAIYGDEG